MYFTRYFSLLFIALGLASCGASTRMASSGDYYAEPAYDGVKVSSASEAPREPRPRKIIYNAQLNLVVDSIAPTQKRALTLAQDAGGYMVQSSSHTLQVRVPADQLDAILAAYRALGTVDYENINTKDVTDEYLDLTIRRENAEKARVRYLELLEKATTVEEILKVERELERLNGELDRIKGVLKSYDQQVAFSIVSLKFAVAEDRVRPGPLGHVFVGAYKAIRWLFVWD